MGSAGKEMIGRHGKGEVKGMIWDKKNSCYQGKRKGESVGVKGDLDVGQMVWEKQSESWM